MGEGVGPSPPTVHCARKADAGADRGRSSFAGAIVSADPALVLIASLTSESVGTRVIVATEGRSGGDTSGAPPASAVRSS